jgi:FlaA1/EpsC-like NDP-sugar epimerase
MQFAFLQFQFRGLRRIVLFAFDTIAGCFSFYLAYYLRFEGDIPREALAAFFSLIPLVLFSRAVAYYYFGFYTRFWKYSSLEDLIHILKAVATGTLLILFIAFLYHRALLIPRSVIIIDMMLLTMMLGGSRLAWRMYRERFLQTKMADDVHHLKALILGAGDAGAHLLRYIKRFAPQYQVRGFIDNDPAKLNISLSGVRVLGNRHSIPKLVQELKIKEILISTNTILPECLEEVIDICNQCGVKYKIATSITDLSTKEAHISKIRNIDIRDLLGRDPVSLDLTSLKSLMKGKRVLVTGAGGSIGSELCRQILEYSPSSLVMVDRCENYLHELQATLSLSHSDTLLSFIFSSITNQEKIRTLFIKHQPQLVFHAAAHKHVPLMEDNPDEATINNIIGTRVVAEASEKFGIEKFILVSTDKVVKPSSVMGMTKHIAEKFIQHIGRNSNTHFMIVRFGNVLGSNGSVVPIFKKQISEGRAVTVTHPEMERYFMLIPEAAQLILQAAAIGEGRNIFLLEMGQPIKIVDLARKMIRVAGYAPDQDIEIIFTGIRPGEKLQEELINSNETIVPTSHNKISILNTKAPEIPDFETRLDALYRIAKNGNSDDTIKALWSLGEGEERNADAMNSRSRNIKKPLISI